MPVQASQPIPSVPFQVNGHALVIPGPRIFNTIPAAPALLFNSWDAQTVIFAQATSIAGAQTFGTLPNLRSIEYPNVTNIGAAITCSTAVNLQNFSIGSPTTVTANITITNAKLTEESVNNVLIALAAAEPTGLTFNFSGGTSAVPTGAGLAAKVALAVSNTVTTN